MRQNLTELPALVDLASDIGVPEVYVQRLVLTHRGLARADQSLYGQLRAKEEASLAEATERANVRGVAFRASGLSSPEDSLRRRGDGHGSLDAARDSTVGLSHDWPWLGCYRMWRMTYITANGNVLPCCISPFSARDYASLVLGNVFGTPFAQIWNAPKYVERRAALYTAAPCHPCELCGVRWSL
jgi:MoaA/NifB/PqqE/SkfB family radical SAM enzyme